jgi:hypothetical protein
MCPVAGEGDQEAVDRIRISILAESVTSERLLGVDVAEVRFQH